MAHAGSDPTVACAGSPADRFARREPTPRRRSPIPLSLSVRGIHRFAIRASRPRERVRNGARVVRP